MSHLDPHGAIVVPCTMASNTRRLSLLFALQIYYVRFRVSSPLSPCNAMEHIAATHNVMHKPRKNPLVLVNLLTIFSRATNRLIPTSEATAQKSSEIV